MPLLAKFMTSMLDLVIPKDHCTKDSFSFCKEIKKVSSTNKFLISYDICSLFTRIPLNETIFRIRLGQLKLFFNVLSKLVVLGTFFDQKKKN